jgi:15-cis-phytoene synthase
MATTSATRPSVDDITYKVDARVYRTLTTGPPVDIDAAYDACEQITRAQARDFYSAIETLPAYRRRALCAIYAFALRVHEIANSNVHRVEKLCLLAEARTGIPRDGAPRPVDPVLVALRDVNRRFRLPLGSLDDLIDGAKSGVYGVTYDTFEDLVGYCRQVAGSIGRLSVAVLGSRDPAAAARLADDLGVAMQLTRILRVLVDDYERGRIYLPREELARFGCGADPGAAASQALSGLIRYQARRNRRWYERALSLLPLMDARGAACIVALTRSYERLLDRVENAPNELLLAQHPS